ncbi:hypothetical protein N0V82_004918 [Gnomoniopsis sp. IMI 355080]|nr:hypothetical protein N0V82_004918 [Gnomoniopsis sp. IMI 355080]
MRSRADQFEVAYHQRLPAPDPPSTPKIPAEIIKPWILPPPQTYIFQNINIVDPISGTILPNRNVHLANGKITSITSTTQPDSRATTPLLQNAISIDGTGKFLSPGLIDAHVHLTSVPGEPDLRSAMSVPSTVSLLRQPFQARAMLARGFTTVRDCGGASLALKEAIADGVFPGPRLFIAGHALSQTGGHGDRRSAHERQQGGGCGCDELAGLSQVVDGEPEVLRAAREQLRQGADFLKLMVGGGVASPTDRLGSTQFTDGEIRAAAGVAAASETFATAHAYTARAIRRAVENGVRGIEHGNFVDAATAAFMAARGVYLTPTLIAYKAMADPRYAAFLPAESREKNEMVLREGLASLRIAQEAGVTMSFGSDLLSFLGVEQLGEFGLRAQVLAAEEVLKHATVNPAKMLGQEERLGQVGEGFVADVLVLNANPLQDITVFERPEKHLLAVIKEGRVYNSRWSKLPVDVNPRTSLLE